MKHMTLLIPVLLAAGVAHGAELPFTKAACDAVLTAEVKRLEEGFARTRDAWERSVAQRFSDHDKDLTSSQMQSARATFDQLVLKLSSEHIRAVSLPGLYRMLLTIPQYDVGVCSKPVEMRALGDQAITGFLLQLTELLPLVETSVSAAQSDG